jgi:hypothetical protein
MTSGSVTAEREIGDGRRRSDVAFLDEQFAV